MYTFTGVSIFFSFEKIGKSEIIFLVKREKSLIIHFVDQCFPCRKSLTKEFCEQMGCCLSGSLEKHDDEKHVIKSDNVRFSRPIIKQFQSLVSLSQKWLFDYSFFNYVVRNKRQRLFLSDFVKTVEEQHDLLFMITSSICILSEKYMIHWKA